MPSSNIYSATDGTISITGLTQQPSGVVVTGATVTGTLTDATGAPVAGWTGISLSDQGGGTYTAAFAAASVPPVGTYSFVVTAVKSGMTLTVEHDFKVSQFSV
jgi:hypothetical protein